MTPTLEELKRFTSLPTYLKQIAALVALGSSGEEIAFTTGLQRSTVTSYKSHLLKAVKIGSDLKLAVFIVRHPQIEAFLRKSL